MFLRSKIAWYISLLGAGLFFTVSIAGFLFVFVKIPQATDPTDGIGYALIATTVGFVFSLMLLIGLFRIRKSCFQKSGPLVAK